MAITYGRIFSQVYSAKNKINNFDILKLNKIYPINKDIFEILNSYKNIIFFEEGIKSGGIAEHIGSGLNESGYKGKYVINAIESEFIPAGKTEDILKKYLLDTESVLEAFKA